MSCLLDIFIVLVGVGYTVFLAWRQGYSQGGGSLSWQLWLLFFVAGLYGF